MQDLLASLEDTATKEKDEVNKSSSEVSDHSEKLANVNIVDRKTGQSYIEKINKNKNIPNPKNKTGAKKIEKDEREMFSNVLRDTRFKENPFTSLKESIANRLKNGNVI